VWHWCGKLCQCHRGNQCLLSKTQVIVQHLVLSTNLTKNHTQLGMVRKEWGYIGSVVCWLVTFSCICYWFNILGFRCAWVCVSPVSAWGHLQPLQMFICFSQLWNICNSVTGIVLVLIQQNSCFWVSDRSAFYMWGKNIKDNFA